MQKLFAIALLFSMMIGAATVNAQRKTKHRKQTRIPVGTGTIATSWDPEVGSAFFTYTRNLPVITKVEVNQWKATEARVELVASRTVLGEDAEQFAKIWRRLKRGSGAGCFVPLYYLKFYSNESLVLDTEVCFGCDNLSLPGKELPKERWGFDGRGPEGQALLSALKALFEQSPPNNYY